MPNKKVRYDLACGNNRQKGFIGVDIVGKPATQANIVCNLLEFPWPMDSSSADEVFSSHFLEHIPHGDGFHDPLFEFMDEVWRILKPGGLATFVVPYYTSHRAFQDPTHHRFIGEPTFNYFNRGWMKLNKLEHYPVKCDFEVVKLDHAISEEYIGKAIDTINYGAIHFWNVIQDLKITLKKVKP